MKPLLLLHKPGSTRIIMCREKKCRTNDGLLDSAPPTLKLGLLMTNYSLEVAGLQPSNDVNLAALVTQQTSTFSR